jgi:hypothetical protein
MKMGICLFFFFFFAPFAAASDEIHGCGGFVQVSIAILPFSFSLLTACLLSHLIKFSSFQIPTRQAPDWPKAPRPPLPSSTSLISRLISSLLLLLLHHFTHTHTRSYASLFFDFRWSYVPRMALSKTEPTALLMATTSSPSMTRDLSSSVSRALLVGPGTPKRYQSLLTTLAAMPMLTSTSSSLGRYTFLLFLFFQFFNLTFFSYILFFLYWLIL